MDYEALSRHGYRGGPSVLKVPPPRVEEKEQDWSWSTGRENNAKGNTAEESYEDRERTRAALAQAEEKLIGVQANSQASKTDKKNLSFSQKEKRKRTLVRLAGERTMSKRRRGCCETVVSILVLILDNTKSVLPCNLFFSKACGFF
uniref:Uncharacterized protein n=1 Tax=Ananas comosus var. bracteatus TaxID=296719 RepID=A0A6V7QSQ4_ANACO